MNRTLFMDLKVGEALQIGGGITVTLEQKSGQRAKLRFDGCDEVRRVPDRRAEPREGQTGRRSTDG